MALESPYGLVTIRIDRVFGIGQTDERMSIRRSRRGLDCLSVVRLDTFS